MSVSSCISCVYVSCVHPVAVLNAAFCMTFRLLMLVFVVRLSVLEIAEFTDNVRRSAP